MSVLKNSISASPRPSPARGEGVHERVEKLDLRLTPALSRQGRGGSRVRGNYQRPSLPFDFAQGRQRRGTPKPPLPTVGEGWGEGELSTND